MLQKVVSGLDLWNIILSAVVCGTCVIDPYTFFASEDYFREGNPPCNAEDSLRAEHLVIEVWFRGY